MKVRDSEVGGGESEEKILTVVDGGKLVPREPDIATGGGISVASPRRNKSLGVEGVAKRVRPKKIQPLKVSKPKRLRLIMAIRESEKP